MSEWTYRVTTGLRFSKTGSYHPGKRVDIRNPRNLKGRIILQLIFLIVVLKHAKCYPRRPGQRFSGRSGQIDDICLPLTQPKKEKKIHHPPPTFNQAFRPPSGKVSGSFIGGFLGHCVIRVAETLSTGSGMLFCSRTVILVAGGSMS